MAELIRSHNCLTGWRDACKHIISKGDGANLMVSLDSPLGFSQENLDEVIQSGLISRRAVDDVANTIFPWKLFARNPALSLQEITELHNGIYQRGKRLFSKNKSRWGNYFLRFTSFGEASHNQLHNIIAEINRRKQSFAACYIMHTSSIDLDSNTRTIGNPCLQYVQFAQRDGAIDLTAVYRNHDFLEKALGNYIGLAHLLSYACNETNHNMGSLTCHSIHYYLPNKRKVQAAIGGFSW